MDENEDALEDWPGLWISALKNRFPDEWQQLAARVGSGLRQLLDSPGDLDQAYYSCANGLLAARQPNMEAFRIAGERLLQDAVAALD